MNNLRLLNKYEEITFEKLQNSVEREAHVFAKVRLADVFPINESGIDDKEYSYCLKAHFDFLITDKNYMPLFSVEYDGKQHKFNKKQIENDNLKDSLCEKFKHPILRINSKYIDREYKGIDLLTYFVDIWFLEKSFYDAQEKGIIPYNEPFDASTIFDIGNKNKWPYWISSNIQIEIQNIYKQKKIRQPSPSFWVGTDTKGNYHCICWLETNEENVIYVKTGMRRQLYTAVDISDLLSMLAIFDLDKKLKEYFLGNESTTSISEFNQILKHFCSQLKPRMSATSGNIGYPVF